MNSQLKIFIIHLLLCGVCFSRFSSALLKIVSDLIVSHPIFFNSLVLYSTFCKNATKIKWVSLYLASICDILVLVKYTEAKSFEN